MLKQTDIKYITQRRNFVQNVNQISEQNKQNKHRDAISKEVLPDVLKKIQVFWDKTPHWSVNVNNVLEEFPISSFKFQAIKQDSCWLHHNNGLRSLAWDVRDCCFYIARRLYYEGIMEKWLHQGQILCWKLINAHFHRSSTYVTCMDWVIFRSVLGIVVGERENLKTCQRINFVSLLLCCMWFKQQCH